MIMEKMLLDVFVENIESFLDNMVGLYNIGILPDITSHKLYNEMILLLMSSNGSSVKDYEDVIKLTERYINAKTNNKECFDLKAEIKRIITK